MTQEIPTTQPPAAEPRSGGGCRIFAIITIFLGLAIIMLAACGIIALAVANQQGLLADLLPAPSPTVAQLPGNNTNSTAVPTLAPTSTPTVTPTNTATPTNTPTETPIPTETDEATETPPPTNTNVPAPAAPQPTAVPPTEAPAAAPPPAQSSQGLSVQFNVENPNASTADKVWFTFVLNNPGSSAVSWGILGVSVEKDGQNQPDLFQTSWTAPNDYTPLQPGQSLDWRDGVSIPTPGTYVLHFTICYSDISVCQGSGGQWEYLGAAAQVTVN